ncbi:SDR family oxidoreductase [Haloarchaeobius salinus]|uniref:SDR family oxidoreductase n=1 Tax=Haloarchaeobius salinus TaxID=1198298 RepID=UPI002108C9FA|nr:SDR family oxidoreductase [Haloarchaeobius salinus]
MTELLTDRTAVVTGGSSGIGRGIALSLAGHGADVVVADIDPEPRGGGIKTVDLIAEDTNGSGAFVECDVSKTSDLEQAVEAAEEAGGLDIMVNNAGILHRQPFLDITESDYDDLLDVNLRGTFFGSQIAARKMRFSGGTIINVASDAALKGYGNRTTYCASKGAIRTLTFAMAEALGPQGIRVNAILPGLTETQMSSLQRLNDDEMEDLFKKIPLRRAGQPSDVGDVAVFLASDLARYVSGASLLVDGGLTNTDTL